MPKRTQRSLIGALLLVGALALAQVSNASAISFSRCPGLSGFSCATLSVPLSRSAALAGTVSLHIARKLSGADPSRTAVVALAGGPGQAALPLASYFSRDMAPALRTRDLLVFDQRGTGESNPLECQAFSPGGAGSNARSIGQLFERCALQIGPVRGSYTSAESVNDIEAIRASSGYEKLVLYGTSYGTKVAMQYAERYPQYVEALVLDSVVPPEGPEPFGIPTLEGIRPMLDELCSNHACGGITPSPLSELARLASQLHRQTLMGFVFDGSGRRRRATLSEPGLLGILEAGDLNPTLRAMLPSAVRSALQQDPGPLLRLNLLSEGLIPNLPGSASLGSGSDGVDEALFVTTTCEETQFPWRRTSPPSSRSSEALAALRAHPSSDFYPFDASTAWRNSVIQDCMRWPFASAAPPAPRTLPDVPTLILSGAQDLRTPPSYARRIASRIPDSHLVVVPYTGHSVLGSDFSGCAKDAVKAFFEEATVQACSTGTDNFSPTPPTPTNLDYVKPIAGLDGKPGRTLTAVLETMTDLARQVIGAALEADQLLPSGSSFGGLRGGYARIGAAAVRLSRFSFVPGVQLSGTFPIRKGTLQPATVEVSGLDAARGAVRLAAGERVAGTLGAKRFNLNVARAKLSATGAASAWPTGGVQFPIAALAHMP